MIQQHNMSTRFYADYYNFSASSCTLLRLGTNIAQRA
jgi:hypothetical protein